MMNDIAENILPDSMFEDNGPTHIPQNRSDIALNNVRPIPRISVQAFFETQGLKEVMEMSAMDRRMEKAHVKVNSGGIPAAIEFFSQAPTPNLLILESTASAEQTIRALDKLSSHCDPGTKVIVIGNENDVHLYRNLISRGISEYMVAPVSMVAILSEISSIFVNSESDPLGRFIAFVGAKGGVGSSTIAHNVSWALSTKIATDVVLADMDVSFGTANIDFDKEPLQHIGDIINAPDRLDETFLDRVLTKCSDKLSLLAAPSNLDIMCDFDRRTFENLFDLLQKGVPYITLDVPHVWNSWSQRVFERADEIVITASPDLASLRNTKLLLDKLAELRPNDKPPMLILNQVGIPKKPEISINEFCNPLGTKPTAILPFNAEVFGTAANNGQMVAEFSPKHEIVTTFNDIAELLTGRKAEVEEKNTSGLSPLLARLGLGSGK